MSELAEGARLEIVCAVKSGTVGSNPTLSANSFSLFGASLSKGISQTPAVLFPSACY